MFRLTFGGRFTSEDKEATRSQIHALAGTPLPPTDPTGATPNFLWAINPLFGAFGIEPYNTIRDERDESKFTPLLTAEYDFNDDVMVYGTFVTGFKSGGFDVRSNGHPDPTVVNALNLLVAPPADIVGVFEFQDEEATSFELGSKMRLAGGRGELNIALYQTDYEDLQTSVFDGILGFNVANASEATIRGLELDGRWLFNEYFTFSGSLGFLDFEFDSFPVAQCYFGQALSNPGSVTGPGTCDASGQRKEYTPELTAALRGDFVYPVGQSLEFRAGLDVIYSDDYIYLPTLDPRGTQDAFTKLNLRLGIGAVDGRWEVALLGKNLSDEDVINFGGNATLAGPLTQGTGNAYYAFVDRPRSVALQFVWRN